MNDCHWLLTWQIISGGADKSLARPTSRSPRVESIVLFEKGVWLCAKFFILQGKAQKEIHAILTETLGGHEPSYAIKT